MNRFKKQKRVWPGNILLIVVIVIMWAALGYALREFYKAAYPLRYAEHVLEQSAKNSLPPELVLAVIRTESGFDPGATSYVQARGLMQITQDTFEWARYRLGEKGDMSFDSLYDAECNIYYGTVILRLLLDEFGSERVALSAYHAGWGSVKRWLADERYSPDGKSLENIPFNDTSRYVDKVLETAGMYDRLYDFK